FGINSEEGAAYFLGEGKIGSEIAAVEPIVEDAANAAHFATVFEIKILVAPFFVLVIVRNTRMRVTSGSHRAVKGYCVGILLATSALEHRGEVGAAAEPGFRRDHIARVHMDCRHMGIVRMGD